MGRYELTDSEWKAIEPCLPNKPRGVPRVNDRRVLNGIFWVLRSGARWADFAGALWAANDHLQSLQSLAEGRRVGPLDGRGHKSPRRERSNDRHVDRSRPSTRCNGKKGVEIDVWVAPAVGSRPKSMRSSINKGGRSG